MAAVSRLQMMNAAVFSIVIVFNVLSSLPSKPFGSTNSDISNEHKTAFTPAGYAFSIWGVIYSFTAAFVIWQASPSRRAWVGANIGYDWIINALGNWAWLVSFNTKAGNLWVSTVVIFAGILGTLLRLYLRLDVGRSGFGHETPEASTGLRAALIGKPTPARPAWITVDEWLCVHTWLSVYMGWVTVACVANVSISLTPEGTVPSLGWTATNWSVLMQCVAFTLGLLALATRYDVAYAGALAWALVAIGAQQKSSAYPGGPVASQAGYGLGYTLAAFCVATAGYRLYMWRSGRTKFASRGTTDGYAGLAAALDEADGTGKVMA